MGGSTYTNESDAAASSPVVSTPTLEQTPVESAPETATETVAAVADTATTETLPTEAASVPLTTSGETGLAATVRDTNESVAQ